MRDSDFAENFEFIMEDADPERIDKLLSVRFPDFSRSYLQKLVKEDYVLVNQKPVKPNHKVNPLDTIIVSIPEPELPEILPEDIPLDILYEDADILVVNKPKGMVVHPAPGHYSGTLVNAVMYHCQGNLSGINGVARPGIVHRIDRDTTGSLVVCKNDQAHQSLAEQLKAHSITRKYQVIVHGDLEDESGSICAPIGRHPVERKKMSVKSRHGKPAVTHYTVLRRIPYEKAALWNLGMIQESRENGDTLDKRYRTAGNSNRKSREEYTYIECQLETGRTHQIRVHMSHIGHPILGDTVYGPSRCPLPLEGQTLQAKILGFVHPGTGKYIEFDAPLPRYFQQLLEQSV